MPVTSKEFDEILAIGSKKRADIFRRLNIPTSPDSRTTHPHKVIIDIREQLTDNPIG
jgi:hypothetical protein